MRTARILWLLLGAAASVHVLISPERHNLWPVFRKGALGWWSGRILYVGPDYFRYSPVFATVLAPFVALPGAVGNILFDLLGLALLFHAIRRLTRAVFPESVLSRNEAAVLVLSLAGVIRSVWSSQAHTWCAALIFFGAAALVEERWWAGAITLTLAVHLKLSPIVLVAIVAGLWPRKMSWRLSVAFGAWTALPFIRGHPGQTVEMYRDWLTRLHDLSALRLPGARDVLHLFEIAHIALPVGAYRALQALCGLVVLWWSWNLRRRGVSATWLVSGSFALTISYMLLLGPAVEFTQYPLLAPWVSAAVLAARRRSREHLVLGAVYVMTMILGFGAAEDALGRLLLPRLPEAFLTLGTMAFAAWVLLKWRREPATTLILS